MTVVGLTGGIASGKSFVVGYLKKLKIPVHESDKVVAKLYELQEKNFISFLLKEGFESCVSKNKINKKIIREIIFNNKEKKLKIEKYIHKKVGKSRIIFLKKNKNQRIIFLDIPLLFENNLEHLCDVVCSVIAPLNIRKKRALQRRGMKNELFCKIVKNQVKDPERKRKSDHIINTSISKSKTYLQVNNIIYDIKNKTSK